MVQVNANDYHRHFAACMYEDYENEGDESPVSERRTMATCLPHRPYSCAAGLSMAENERNRHNVVAGGGIGEQPTSTTAVKRHKSGKSSYKHIPHREKPPHLVERRNARERRRVQAVNNAFARLRKCVPLENRNKRLSKVKTLHKAIEYITHLQQILSDEDDDAGDVRLDRQYQTSGAINKENSENSRWITMDQSCHKHPPSYIALYDHYTEFPN